MPARQGRLYGVCVLRPLAERLVDLLAVHPGESCLDAPCDGGVLATALARAAGARGAVHALDDDLGALDAVAEAVGARRLPAIRPGIPPTRPVDVAACLLSAPHAAAGTVAALRRLGDALRPGGRLGAAVWGARAAVPHEAGLADLLAAAGRPCAQLEAGLSLGAPKALLGAAAAAGLAGAEVLRVGDVVRFDGAVHLFAAVVADRPAVAAAVAGLDAAARGRLEAALGELLRGHTASDGTLVIPVELAILRWTRPGGPGGPTGAQWPPPRAQPLKVAL